MNQAGSGLFAASTLAEDQHRNIGHRQQFCLRPKLSHDWAGPDEENVATDLFDIVTGDVRLDDPARCRKVAPNNRFEWLALRGA